MFPITALYAALCGLLVLALAFNVVRYRFGRGFPGRRRRRAHHPGGARPRQRGGVHPLALILIGLLEGNNANAWALHLYGRCWCWGGWPMPGA